MSKTLRFCVNTYLNLKFLQIELFFIYVFRTPFYMGLVDRYIPMDVHRVYYLVIIIRYDLCVRYVQYLNIKYIFTEIHHIGNTYCR